MKILLRCLLGFTAYAAFSAQAVAADAEGCADNPLFKRLPNYRIESCEPASAGSVQFKTKAGAQTVEGNRSVLIYSAASEKKQSTGRAIVQNFTRSVKAKGGKI